MAKIKYDYYSGKDIYNDGEIEDLLLNHYKNGKEINFNDDETFYLTNDVRHNIVSWYPFKDGCTIMEIGAGCGTITKRLCELAKRVISVEASKKRAEILFERNKQFDNLEVYVSNIENLPLKFKADYIILNGVFEYSKIFVDDEKPFDCMLNILKKHMNKDGIILIAIENRYGIKYFSGNSEDHIGKKYAGLFGYDNEKVETFGKKQLKDIFDRNNFKYHKFYSVFPDYKMPQLIFSDKYKFSEYELLSFPVYNHNPHEEYFFDYRKVLKGLQDNNMLSFFANSFLCELSVENSKLSNIDYVKFQPYRTSKYNTYTFIEGDKIYKKANSIDSINHLKNISKIHQDLNKHGISCSTYLFKDNELKIERAKGESIEDILQVNINNEKEFKRIFNNYVGYLKKFCVKKNINSFGDIDYSNIYDETLVLTKSLLDLNLGNVFLYNNEYTIIDQEFESKYDLPLDYTIYFSIKLFFEKQKDFTHKNLEEELYRKFKITIEKQNLFNKISEYYFNEELKINDPIKVSKIISHGSINSNNIYENLNNDLIFYKELLDKTVDGYEKEIKRLTDICNKRLLSRIKRIIKKYIK